MSNNTTNDEPSSNNEGITITAAAAAAAAGADDDAPSTDTNTATNHHHATTNTNAEDPALPLSASASASASASVSVSASASASSAAASEIKTLLTTILEEQRASERRILDEVRQSRLKQRQWNQQLWARLCVLSSSSAPASSSSSSLLPPSSPASFAAGVPFHPPNNFRSMAGGGPFPSPGMMMMGWPITGNIPQQQQQQQQQGASSNNKEPTRAITTTGATATATRTAAANANANANARLPQVILPPAIPAKMPTTAVGLLEEFFRLQLDKYRNVTKDIAVWKECAMRYSRRLEGIRFIESKAKAKTIMAHTTAATSATATTTAVAAATTTSVTAATSATAATSSSSKPKNKENDIRVVSAELLMETAREIDQEKGDHQSLSLYLEEHYDHSRQKRPNTKQAGVSRQRKKQKKKQEATTTIVPS